MKLPILKMEIKKVTPVYDKLAKCKAKTVVCVGGARSSKSHSLEQVLIYKLVNEKHKKIGITRKTFPALRRTAYDLFIGLLKEYGIYREANHNKSFYTYEHGTNKVEFFSMDDPEKLKSTGFSYIWIEEANEFTYEDYFTLWLRLSEPTKEGERNQIFLSFNPIDENNWIAKTLIHEDDVEVIHSTYKDNPFLEDDYVKSLESIIDKDSNYYRVYVLGEWGNLENLIYNNWDMVDELPEEYNAMCYGLDFGYVNPTALVKVCLVEGEIYLDEVLYKSHLTNSDVIDSLSHIEKGDIYADRDELQRIEEISRAGYVAYPGEKDVKMGIDLCNRHKLHITKRSVNGIKELRGYMRKKDKDNNVLEDPIKHNDHFCLVSGTQVKTIGGDKAIEDIKHGDMVLTRQGYHPVVACGLTDAHADVVTASFSDGSSLTGTGNHPVWIKDKGFIPLDTLRYCDIMEVWKENELFTKESHTEGIQTQRQGQREFISEQVGILNLAHATSTGKFGKMFMGMSQKVIMSITKTIIPSIMSLITLSASLAATIYQTIRRGNIMTFNILPEYALLPLNGIVPQRGGNGIANTLFKHTRNVNRLRKHVNGVVNNTLIWQDEKAIGFVPTLVSVHGAERVGGMMKLESVLSVGSHLQPLNTSQHELAHGSAVRCLGVKNKGKQPVYNLSVDTVHEYYANGILVSNCDAMRFGVYGLVSRFGFATAKPFDNREVLHSFRNNSGSTPVPRPYDEIVHKFNKGDVREILRR